MCFALVETGKLFLHFWTFSLNRCLCPVTSVIWYNGLIMSIINNPVNKRNNILILRKAPFLCLSDGCWASLGQSQVSCLDSSGKPSAAGSSETKPDQELQTLGSRGLPWAPCQWWTSRTVIRLPPLVPFSSKGTAGRPPLGNASLVKRLSSHPDQHGLALFIFA